MMSQWRIDVAYNGVGLYGFQSQADGNKVQDKLENALSTVTRQKIKITGGSRTDSGVHAEHQVCMFKSEVSLDPKKSVRALNALLPNKIFEFLNLLLWMIHFIPIWLL